MALGAAYRILEGLFTRRRSQEEASKKLGFGSVEAMRQQFENWGLPEWLVGEMSSPGVTGSISCGAG
jgi:hypothetical protein